MTEIQPPVKPRGTIGALKNVSAFLELVFRVRDRAPSLPNIGVMYGHSGYGKTYASIYAQNRTRAIRVEVGDTWTRKTLLTAILQECGVVRPQGSISELSQQVIAELASELKRPLFIDEADKICDKGYIELVREIAMGSNVPVLLIGEELLPQKLSRVERVHNRILDWYGAEPCDLEDARALADLLLAPVAISDDLLDDIRVKGEGRARRIATSLDGVANWAKNNGAKTVTRESYTGAIYTGEPPRARSIRINAAKANGGRAA
ncbi:ATP-binding protein [Methylocystis sp. WRRC1]|uniref:AAA family ATPase n=1 Tax=unclassified Methylocystis TaxID=2625913 RepID=UPI0001F86841|nr:MULTISPECIES: ATP-binding protein [unclassified Methylocystis]MCC3246181.1 ATP-binding protein [Methylocystis sp. WRRC1]